jgi:hypothetical protein
VHWLLSHKGPSITLANGCWFGDRTWNLETCLSREGAALAKRSRYNPSRTPMKNNRKRAFIEIGFIVFLFYSNLLMGEFERSGMGEKKGLVWALSDVFTAPNLGIAIIAATIGYVLLEFLRNRV